MEEHGKEDEDSMGGGFVRSDNKVFVEQDDDDVMESYGWRREEGVWSKIGNTERSRESIREQKENSGDDIVCEFL